MLAFLSVAVIVTVVLAVLVVAFVVVSVIVAPDNEASALTVTVTSSVTVVTESDTLRRKTYVPVTGKVACVTSKLGAASDTCPGPLTCVHCVASGWLPGTPSSDAAPVSVVVAGWNTLRSGPALAVWVGQILMLTSGSVLHDY